MTWFSVGANETEAQKTHVQHFVAVYADFPSGQVRFWSGTGNLVIGGTSSGDSNALSAMNIGMPWRHGYFYPDATAAVSAYELNAGMALYAGAPDSSTPTTFVGAGTLGRVSASEERVGTVGERKKFQLTGVDPTLVSESDIAGSFGRTIIEYYGFLDPVAQTLVGDMEVNWQGRIDSIRRVDGKAPVIEINAEHWTTLLGRSDGWQFTHEHQQRFFPGDNGYNQVLMNNGKTLLWGEKLAKIGSPRLRSPTPSS